MRSLCFKYDKLKKSETPVNVKMISFLTFEDKEGIPKHASQSKAAL